MKKIPILILAAALTACSEKMDVHPRNMDRTYLVVEAMLTDQADRPQIVKLTESVDYFEPELPPAVSGAEVSVSDGIQRFSFTETPQGSGCYAGPDGFYASPGKQYRLNIDAVIAGEKKSYEAVSTMPESGFELDAIDYMYAGNASLQLDSLWTIACWGRDLPSTSYYFVSASVNGAAFPYDLSIVMDDKYFNGQEVTCFPISTLYQTAQNQKLYGECCKYLETGDVITVTAYSLPRDYYDFFMAFASNGIGSAIPLLQSQPANCPTNITGGDAAGWFAVCSTTSASVVVEDPLRPYYAKAQPQNP